MKHNTEPTLRRRAAVCALVLALSLAAPPAVFALWDARLLNAALPLDAADALPPLAEAARANEVACLLYAQAHLLQGSAGTSLAAASGSDIPAGTGPVIDAMRQFVAAGLLTQAEFDAFCAALPADGTAANGRMQLRCTRLPGGLTRYSVTQIERETDDGTLSVRGPEAELTVVLTPQGVPVDFRYQTNPALAGDPVRPGALESYLALTGLDEFTDWQAIDWSGTLPQAGEAAYSPTAQLYVTVNAADGLTATAASMTEAPDTGS